MFCKYCGSQIADDSVFCAKCGKLVVEASSSSTNQSATQIGEPQWWATDNLQWKKPTKARGVQIFLLVILGLLLLYPLWCFVSGGEVREIYGAGYGMDRHHEVHVYDPWELKIMECTNVNMYNFHHSNSIYRYSFSESDAQSIYRWRMLLLLLPFLVLIWLTIRWIKSTRFPNEKDIVPRDVADEIEQYEWDGYSRYKYVFFKKDGKYGIIDARNYCVKVPAQYDLITWRMPNKTIDVVIGEEKQTITIEKEPEKRE